MKKVIRITDNPEWDKGIVSYGLYHNVQPYRAATGPRLDLAKDYSEESHEVINRDLIGFKEICPNATVMLIDIDDAGNEIKQDSSHLMVLLILYVIAILGCSLILGTIIYIVGLCNGWRVSVQDYYLAAMALSASLWILFGGSLYLISVIEERKKKKQVSNNSAAHKK